MKASERRDMPWIIAAVRAFGRMSYRSDSTEVIEPSAVVASQLPQGNVTPDDLPA
jgi:hypothetical protein